MPYDSKKTGKNQITVTKKDTGEVVGHTTPAKYDAYMAALHIHDKPEHKCEGGCVGYARGGSVAPTLPAYRSPGVTPAGGGGGKINTTDILAALGALGVAIPALKMKFGGGEKPVAPVSQDLRDNLGDLKQIPDVMGMASGGMIPEEDKDPSVIPEDIKEYIQKTHKATQESRPDEAWRITPPAKPESVAPYKRDEESLEAEAEAEKPGMAKGGVVPGYDAGGDVQPPDIDPNQVLADVAPVGTGSLVPSPAPQVASAAPKAPPAIPEPAPPVSAPVNANPAAPASTDADFMARANKMLGLDPNQQAAFMRMLGQKSQNSQIGAGIAGIGDAIAAGGTLGKVNPGALNKSEEIAQNATKEGIEGLESIRGGQEKAFDVAQKLQAQDPNSPLSKYAQKAYGSIGKKLGLDLSHASASLIGDVSGKGVDALNTEYQNQLKMMGIDLQKKQVEATVANQEAERRQAAINTQQEAAKTLADRGILKTVANAIPGTTGNKAAKVLERTATGNANFSPDVIAYAQKHGISPEQAQNVKDKRTGGT